MPQSVTRWQRVHSVGGSKESIVAERIALVLLPGMLCDDAYWQPQANALRDLCKVQITEFGLMDNVSAMAECVLSQAPSRFVVCGHSMGGRVVQEISRLCPERLLGIGLFGTDYRAPADSVDRQRELENLLAIADRAQRIGMSDFGREWARRLLPAKRHWDEELLQTIARMIERQSPDVIRAQARAGAFRPDYRDLLPQIGCPALVVAGELDVLRPLEPHEYMARHIPNARLVVIADAGHMMSMERPEQTTAAIRHWLETAVIGRV